jgi:ABC-type nitrate/sulfonate/bicarbonate transport system ATPase subunit
MLTGGLALSAKEIRMEYRDRQTRQELGAIEEMDIDIPEGQFVRIVGPMWCG